MLHMYRNTIFERHWNWGLGRLMHHLFKIMYNTLDVNLVYLSKLTTINLIDLMILMEQQ